jgi:hypothetical protein
LLNFDEDFVLIKMYQGKSEAEAIQEWQNLVQGQAAVIQQNTQRVPPVLNGSGQVPNEQQSLADIPRASLRKFVEGVLQQANSQT